MPFDCCIISTCAYFLCLFVVGIYIYILPCTSKAQYSDFLREISLQQLYYVRLFGVPVWYVCFFIYEYPSSVAQDEWPYHVILVRSGPARRLHSTLVAVCGRGDTRAPIKSSHAVIHIGYDSPQKRFSAGCSSFFLPLAKTTHGT